MSTLHPLAVALVVVLSVVAGAAGAAAVDTTAAASTAEVLEATEYGDEVELALDSGTDSPIRAANVDVWVDGEPRSVQVAVDGTDGRVVLSGTGGVDPTQELIVNVDQSGDLVTGNVTATVSGGVQRAGRSGGSYPGTPIAYVASGTGVSFDVLVDGEWVNTRSTGQNSRVHVVSTDDASVGTTYTFEETAGGSAETTVEFRDLDLTATADPTTVEASGSFTVEVLSRDSNRPVLYEVVDLDSGTVVRTVRGRVGSDGSGSTTIEGLDEGQYEVRVVDANSGITTTTEAVTVGSGPEGAVEFPDGTVEDQRGDVVDVPVSFVGPAAGGTVDLELADLDGTFRATVTVEDADGDGRAVLHWNTYESTNGTAGLWVSGGDATVTVEEPAADRVAAAEYSLTAHHGGSNTDITTVFLGERATESVAVLTAPDAVDLWDGAAQVRERATVGETVAMDPITRHHDWLVVRISASGLEGYVDDAADLAGSSHGLELTVVQTEASASPNQALQEVDVAEATLLADGDEDTYYLAVRPEVALRDAERGDAFEARFSVDADGNPVTAADETAAATVEFVNGTASPDARDGEVVVRNAADATVSGTSTFAPGTTLTVDLRSEGGTQPFATDAETEVRADGTWEATVDLSDRPDDQTFTATVLKADRKRAAAPGRVGTPGGESTPRSTDSSTPATASVTPSEATPRSTDSPTPTAVTESTPRGTGTPTSTGAPGFGALVAVAALAAAALLVRRQD